MSRVQCGFNIVLLAGAAGMRAADRRARHLTVSGGAELPNRSSEGDSPRSPDSALLSRLGCEGEALTPLAKAGSSGEHTSNPRTWRTGTALLTAAVGRSGGLLVLLPSTWGTEKADTGVREPPKEPRGVLSPLLLARPPDRLTGRVRLPRDAGGELASAGELLSTPATGMGIGRA